MQARNFNDLKTNVNSITATKLKNLERKADKVPQCRIARPYAKGTMTKLLKQKNLLTRSFPQSVEGLLKHVSESVVHMRANHNNRMRYKGPCEPVSVSVVSPNIREYILGWIQLIFKPLCSLKD